MFLQFVKFCLVGGSGMLLDFSLTFLLKEKIKINRYGANVVGFLCAASSNFLLNKHWTFSSTAPEVSHQFSSFLIFSLLGLGINTIFLIVFEKQNINFYLAKFLAIMLTTIWNFTTNYVFTFNG